MCKRLVFNFHCILVCVTSWSFTARGTHSRVPGCSRLSYTRWTGCIASASEWRHFCFGEWGDANGRPRTNGLQLGRDFNQFHPRTRPSRHVQGETLLTKCRFLPGGSDVCFYKPSQQCYFPAFLSMRCLFSFVGVVFALQNLL